MGDVDVHALIVAASTIIGFGILVIMFRVEREVRVQDQVHRRKKDELEWAGERRDLRHDELVKSHIADADWLIIAAISLAVVVLIALLGAPPPVSATARSFAAVSNIFAVILQLGYVPSILAHYGIGFDERVTAEQRTSSNPTERKLICAAVLVAITVSLFCWVMHMQAVLYKEKVCGQATAEKCPAMEDEKNNATAVFGVDGGSVNWIYRHQNELQAISGLAVALLTLVLIIVTGVYATANWRTMRLVEADVRFRVRPVPRLGLAAANAWNSPNGQLWILTLRSEHALLCLVAANIRFAVGGGHEVEYFHSFNGEVIDLAASFQHSFEIKMPAASSTWILELYYRDHGGLLDYATTFGPGGFVAEGPAINRKTFWNRIRFWIGVRRIRHHMGMR